MIAKLIKLHSLFEMIEFASIAELAVCICADYTTVIAFALSTQLNGFTLIVQLSSSTLIVQLSVSVLIAGFYISSKWLFFVFFVFSANFSNSIVFDILLRKDLINVG